RPDADGRRQPDRLPRPPAARPRTHRHEPRSPARGARARAGGQRRPALAQRGPCRLPAVGAREARARRLGGLLPDATPPAAAAWIAAYAAFAYFGLRIALACKDPFGKRLAAGLTVLVCGQAAINLAAVMGLAPLTGIPLPFVSYGGSSLVVALVSVGILLNI